MATYFRPLSSPTFYRPFPQKGLSVDFHEAQSPRSLLKTPESPMSPVTASPFKPMSPALRNASPFQPYSPSPTLLTRSISVDALSKEVRSAVSKQPIIEKINQQFAKKLLFQRKQEQNKKAGERYACLQELLDQPDYIDQAEYKGAYGSIFIIERTHLPEEQDAAYSTNAVVIKLQKEESGRWEQNILKILKHLKVPHVLFPEDHYVVEVQGQQQLALASEFISGGNLYEQVKGNREIGLRARSLTWKEILLIAKQLLETLAAFEKLHFVHGDLKPDNILFKKERFKAQIKVTDFGLAFFEDSAEQFEDRLLQTRWYRAPEELLALARNRKRLRKTDMDMWSFGCILYFIIVGETLFPSRYEDKMNTKRGLVINPYMIWEHLNFFNQFLPESFCSLFSFLEEQEDMVSYTGRKMDYFFHIDDVYDDKGKLLFPKGSLKNAQYIRLPYFERGIIAVKEDLEKKRQEFVAKFGDQPTEDVSCSPKVVEAIFAIFTACLQFDPNKRIKASEALTLLNEALQESGEASAEAMF